ncbi:hypothetical protein HOP51_19145 [Halomonas sp. MCCC 1A11036]|uniref:Uncharacterized protein n=1 Tax=Billgrantia zhangzhouensis TaxID=2733481 RepID=A0ABS9AK87_9GAMM|nr:hypothetical protein [Halomonas zhangzhouensis]MCE8022211.1 hypothetical protein [Halomonas zhangzhouensis]
MRPSSPSYIADFDSATGMLRAVSNYLHGQDYPGLGKGHAMGRLVQAANWLPQAAREQVYAVGGATEGHAPDKLDRVDAEKVAEWITARYPQRRYQAVMIGSASGALTHLSAAFDIPWLPQTFFIPVRHLQGSNDDPKLAMEFGRRYGPKLLEANPELQLHHMHDANQDRLMVEYMDYFRVKRLTLGRAYERFLEANLEPGGTIIVTECRSSWPTTRIGERHYFQHGALGGATEEEFLHGSERVEEYLERYDAAVRRWDSPEPDGRSPEAEWGFEEALRDDILRFATQRGYKVKRLVFDEPDSLSPLVADFYRDWYRERGMKANRVLVESFIMLEPYWALRTGSVPFWMKFNMDPSVDAIESYLDAREPFDEINLMLFNNGVEAVGFPQIERWQRVLERARKRGQFIGVSEELHPRDFGSLGRYYIETRQKIKARYPLPGPLVLQRLVDFAEKRRDQYAVELLDA